MGFEYSQGANLGKIFPDDVQTAAPCNQPVFIFEDQYVTQIRIQLAQGAGQKIASIGKIPEHFLNLDYIGCRGLPNHVSNPFYPVARSMKREAGSRERESR